MAQLPSLTQPTQPPIALFEDETKLFKIKSL